MMTLCAVPRASMPAQPAAAASVGYQTLTIPDPSGPPVEIGIWYPATDAPSLQPIGPFMQSVATGAPVSGRRLPLVVISHGHGGTISSHLDTALALARAGFVVAALAHTGDNTRDQSRATDMANRPRQLKLLVDYMLGTWPGHARIDPARIGAFGFSSGGFTVLVAAGGRPDLSTMADHCQVHPGAFDCLLFEQAVASPPADPTWVHDPRLRAVVSAAPALGFAFGRAGLAGVTVPVQLWHAEHDHILPEPDYAEAVRANLRTPPDQHVVGNADHFDFLAPCSDILRRAAPEICSSAPGFDRSHFHDEFDRAVVEFFRATLGD